jgi:sugar phosphate isomerase/epimerase
MLDAECGMSGMKRAAGLEHLTMLDIAPPEFVTLAAAAGFDTVGLRIAPVTLGEEVWPVGPGSPMLAETVRRCAGTGVRVLAVEAITFGPQADPARCQPVLETAAELGARYLNVICDDPDISRFTERFATLAGLGRLYGVRPVIEFTAYRPVRTLADAITIARKSAGGAVLLDALHIQRCGVSLGELARLDPRLLSYLQLCDAPRTQPRGLPVPALMPRGQRAERGADAVLEARTMRLLPGEGELPLAALVRVLPSGLPVSVEAPSLTARGEFTPDEYAVRARRALAALLR